jgi:hypothetical protein
MRHLLDVAGNVALVTARQVARDGGFDSVLVSPGLVEKKSADSTRSSAAFPLYLSEKTIGLGGDMADSNFSPRFALAWLRLVGDSSPMALPKSAFAYICAILHSNQYRSRYDAFLRVDFPRVPIPRDVDLARYLADIGSELIGVQLMDSDTLGEPVAVYRGGPEPLVSRVEWVDGTVILDAQRADGQDRPPRGGSFVGVPESVWLFRIGGYQVCEKWLKDRKGRRLSTDDIAHYRQLTNAIARTIRLMGEIDQLIDKYGGWPEAFIAGQA